MRIKISRKEAKFFMQSNNEKNYLEWFRKAEDDELSINVILKEGGAFSTACFLFMNKSKSPSAS